MFSRLLTSPETNCNVAAVSGFLDATNGAHFNQDVLRGNIALGVRLALLALFLMACRGGFAQQTGDSLYYLLPTDTMVLRTDVGSGNMVFEHYLAPKQTLFGTGQFYGLGLEDVYVLNPHLRSAYEPGDKLRVPIPPRAVRPSRALDSLAWFVPVYYQMRKGETIFGLYKRVLQREDASSIMELNPTLDPAALADQQRVAIGYLKLDGIPVEMQGEIEDEYVRLNTGLRELWNNRTEGRNMKVANGKAAWTRKGDKDKWMVLHRTAPINSLIEIDDPRSRKVLYARVVGRIPDQIYPRDVILVVSPLLLKAFGVRDKVFYVRTRHF